LNGVAQLGDDIERETLISLYIHCPAETREALGLHMVEVADALVLSARGLPGILINRCLGLGSRKTLQPSELLNDGNHIDAFQRQALEEIVEIYRREGIDRYFLQLYTDSLSQNNLQYLRACKLEPARAWMKFYREITPGKSSLGRTDSDRATPSTLRIEAISPDRAMDFASLVCQVFEIPEAGVPMLAGFANDPRCHLFVSYQGDQPAGAGALFVQGQCGWLDWGATAPAFRCRGSQSAIMAARIQLAENLGCRHLFTETGEAVAGDPQHSYNNILKAGFQEFHLRQNYAPSKACH